MSIDTRDLPTDIYLNMKADNFAESSKFKRESFNEPASFFPSTHKSSADFTNPHAVEAPRSIKSSQNFKKNGTNEHKFNPFAFKNNRRMLTKDYKIKKKTELCSSFLQTGICKYGDSCAFAHGEHEL